MSVYSKALQVGACFALVVTPVFAAAPKPAHHNSRSQWQEPSVRTATTATPGAAPVAHRSDQTKRMQKHHKKNQTGSTKTSAPATKTSSTKSHK